MFVKLKKNQAGELIIIDEILEETGPHPTQELKPLYAVRDYFYTVRWSEEDQAALYYSPCETGEEKSYITKQIWMVFMVFEDDIYYQLTNSMLEDWQQQDYADSHLSDLS